MFFAVLAIQLLSDYRVIAFILLDSLVGGLSGPQEF